MNEKRRKQLLVGCIAAAVVFALLLGLCIRTMITKDDKKESNHSEPTVVVSNNGDTDGQPEKQPEGNQKPDGDGDSPHPDNPSDPEDNPGTPTPTGKPDVPSGGNGILDTGNLTENGRGYEGIAGTGAFNYGEALQKAILFYELQRSGDIPEQTRCNWRGDSGMQDGADNGVDLTGGWYDAGDNMKFNLPMAYSAAMLAWSVVEDYDSYKESGQLSYALANIRWANDYFMKCHTSDKVYYYQVGDGGADHGWWGPCEVMTMKRPSYKITPENPGSSVVAETAAALAAASLAFAKDDPAYAKECLQHAKTLFAFAEEMKSDAGYLRDGAATAYYNIFSGFEDELAFSAAWLYLATKEETYLTAAKSHEAKANQDYDWALCWDDVHLGAQMLLLQITEDDLYRKKLEANLDFWTTGHAGKKVTYTPKGLAWLDSWGALRYATTEAYLAMVYVDSGLCSDKKAKTYQDFAEAQVNYALGSSGRSYVVGFGENAPKNPHHRTAQGSYCDNMNEPKEARHTLYGALVGGPNSSDGYNDTVTDYTQNEVACDYNAGFVGALAKMYRKYHGKTLKDFGAVEAVPEDELTVQACVNVNGQDFIEIRAYVYNRTGWPARKAENLELRYFVDLSEVYAAGGSVADVVVSTNYMEAGKAGSLQLWDGENYIFYLPVDFSGADILPGSQSSYKKEIQVRIRNTKGTWDNTNDPSFGCLLGNNGSQTVLAETIALYENGRLVFGKAPKEGDKKLPEGTPELPPSDPGRPGETKPQPTQKPVQNGELQAEENGWLIINAQPNSQSTGGTIAMNYTVTNNTGKDISLSELAMYLRFTKDCDTSMSFWCDYAAVYDNQGYYQAAEGVTGEFTAGSGADTDTVCKVRFGNGKLPAGATITLQMRIARSDWGDMNLANDYFSQDVRHVELQVSGRKVFGK